MDARKILCLIRDPQFIADTCSMIVFSWIVGMILEVGVAGMSWQQSMQTRVFATFVNLLTGGLNGTWLNKVRVSFRAERHFIIGFAADVTAFLSFQAILYVVNLSLTGANPEQIMKVVSSATLICGIAGKPYGLFTDLFRKLFRADTNR